MYNQLSKLDDEFFKYFDPLAKLTLEYVDENKNELWIQLNTIATNR